MTPAEISAMAQIGDTYNAASSPADGEVDPLARQEDRDARAEAIRIMRPMPLHEEYVAHRNLTRVLRAGLVP